MSDQQLIFKQRNNRFSRGCASVLQVFFFLVGTIAVIYLLSMLIKGDIELSENWEVLFLIPMYIAIVAGFFVKKAKRNRGKLKLSQRLIRTDDFMMATENVILSVYNAGDKGQSGFHLYSLRDNEGKFFMICIFQDDFFKALMKSGWVPTQIYYNCSFQRVSPNDAEPIYRVACEEENHELIYNLETGAYSISDLDTKDERKKIEPEFFIEDPKYKRVRF